MKLPSALDQAELIGTRLIVWDYKAGLGIYRSGFFGKPVGIPKPKPDPDFEVPLLLDLMEGLYLLEHKRIGVIDGRTKKPVGKSVLLKAARDTYRGFSAAYQVYKDLREKGYVVTPGIKFGSDFAVYEHGPGIDHAPYLVQVEGDQSPVTATGMVRSGRLATTVRKQFIIAVVNAESRKADFLGFDWWRA